jgi:flagellar hook-basal body complex protein FliE
MNVNGSSLAGRLYAEASGATRPQAPTAAPQKQDPAAFGKALHDSAMETLRAVQGAEQTVKSGLAGRADAHSVVEALAQTELAVQTATTVRDKVVEAYNEILRMPV